MDPAPGNVHLDEAIARARAILDELCTTGALRKAVLVNDLFGRIRVAVWPSHDDPGLAGSLSSRLSAACKALWSGAMWLGSAEGAPASDDDVLADAAWEGGVPTDRADRLRINDRHRNRTSWFLPPSAPSAAPPPIVAFYSFKGGVGRTTAAAAFALSWARRGLRVAALDVDFDAPSLGRLLDADGEGTTARWGVVDYLLEQGIDLPLDDYRHTCARAKVTGDGVIDVYPAGQVNEHYLAKLSKLDLEMATIQEVQANPLERLLARIQADSRPDLIVLDSRAGLSPAAGLVLGGIAHVHVVVSTAGEQALDGLRVVIRRLGEDRIYAHRAQAECVLIQAMIPDHPELAARATAHFAIRAEDMFRDHYYARPEPEPDSADGDRSGLDADHRGAEDDDGTWSLADLESSESPHRAVGIRYKPKFADFRRIDDIADELVIDPDYVELVARIDQRLAPFEPYASDDDAVPGPAGATDGG